MLKNGISSASADATSARDGRLRLVVFDFDGTIVDSLEAIILAMSAAWRAHDLNPPDPAAIRRVIGLSLIEAMAILHPEGENALHHGLCEHYKTAFHDLRARPDHDEPLYPGAVEALDALQGAGFLLAIATSKSHRGTLKTLQMHGLEDRFISIQTPDQGLGKPHPDMLLRAVEVAGVEPVDTVMIGDTVFDMEMARNAAITAIGVGWGYHDDADLHAAGASSVLSGFDQLPPAVFEIMED